MFETRLKVQTLQYNKISNNNPDAQIAKRIFSLVSKEPPRFGHYVFKTENPPTGYQPLRRIFYPI